MFKEPNTGCWLSGGKSPYGPIRLAYKLFKGPLEKRGPNIHIMHSCDTPACVNPDHLRLGTRSDNMKDMYAKNRLKNNTVAKYRSKTHCPHGHPYSGTNLVYDTNRLGQKYRKCRICLNARTKRYRSEK